MKRFAILALTFVLLLGLCACGDVDMQGTVPTDSIQVFPGKTEATAGSTTATTAPTEATTEATTVPTTAPATEPVHVHVYSAATCTAPKTCSCGETEGVPAGHRYTDGKCEACGQNDPGYTQEAMVWIPTKGGKKYHSSSTCSGMEEPDHVTLTKAKELGFTACKKCH